MRMYDIIHKKRWGHALTREEIVFFVNEYTSGNIPDYQMSALCMAICCNGMTAEETAWLTDAMMHSGDVVDLSMFGELSVDKHSTGGVGDKTTLVIAPIVASLGLKMAKMSGRGLGHTGGTIDKLESIPGFKTTLPPNEFLDIVDKVGVCVIGQSGELAPADKKIYALRDVTATVDSIPLIASSIMSKKLASGAHSIVLDVKSGNGAFMKNADEAKLLADEMVAIGNACGRRVRALVTNMSIPLGLNVGNALEVEEAVRILRGEQKGDLYEVCVALASNMISLVKQISIGDAQKLVESAVDSGRAFQKMKEWISAQGGDVSVIEDTKKLPHAKYSYRVVSSACGYISEMNTGDIGIAASLLGAGRIAKDDDIDFSAGIVFRAKTGDYVAQGDEIATLYSSNENLFAGAEKKLREAITVSREKVEKPALIY